MNAPLTCPNSSLSSSCGDSDGHDTTLNRLPARALHAWIALASTPLPVPLSPRTSTVASVGATCRARLIARCIAGLALERSASGPLSPSASCSPATFCSSARSSATFCVITESCCGVNGLGR